MLASSDPEALVVVTFDLRCASDLHQSSLPLLLRHCQGGRLHRRHCSPYCHLSTANCKNFFAIDLYSLYVGGVAVRVSQ